MNKHNQLTHDRLKAPYSRVLIPAEDGTYFAQILEFPGCYAEGKTANEAIQNLESSAASWIEAAQAQGQDIPEPFANYGYSGKINLRIPRSIHKRAALFAQKDDISLNQFFTSAIAARVGAEEFFDHLTKKLAEKFMPHMVVFATTYSSTTNQFNFVSHSQNASTLSELSRSTASSFQEIHPHDMQTIESEKVGNNG